MNAGEAQYLLFVIAVLMQVGQGAPLKPWQRVLLAAAGAVLVAPAIWRLWTAAWGMV